MESYSETTGTRVIGVALSGAGGGFARTFLAQLCHISDMTPTILVDLDLDSLIQMLASLGYAKDTWVICEDKTSVDAAVAQGRIALVSDIALLSPDSYDVLVEATGNVSVGFAAADAAISSGRHVVMVSKEVESVAGAFLSDLARTHDVRYLPGKGDQPANLLALLSWVSAVGLEVVAVGKSGEYDLVFDPETGTATMLDESHDAPELGGLLRLESDISRTLRARDQAARSFKRAAAADYCEMAVVAQYTGFVADRREMHYPIVRPSELADIYRLRTDGGILGESGVVDVFTMLKLPGEASFAGGEFVIVRTHDRETWKMLAAKGHVVSSDGKYACIYSPYHLMGVETPLSVYDAVEATAPMPSPRRRAVLIGSATAALKRGVMLRVEGHHHEIDGIQPLLVTVDDLPANAAPFYLLGGSRLARDVAPGDVITVDDLQNFDRDLWRAYLAGTEHRS